MNVTNIFAKTFLKEPFYLFKNLHKGIFSLLTKLKHSEHDLKFSKGNQFPNI